MGDPAPLTFFDVLQIKTALGKLGYYEPHDNEEITGFTDNQLFEGIRRFQKDQNLFPSGGINPEDKTLENLNHQIHLKYKTTSREVESEPLPPILPQRQKIPGTNIPDYGVEEGQMPRQPLGSLPPERRRYKIDRNMERIPPELFDNRILLPYDPLFPHLQKSKGK